MKEKAKCGPQFLLLVVQRMFMQASYKHVFALLVIPETVFAKWWWKRKPLFIARYSDVSVTSFDYEHEPLFTKKGHFVG